MVTDPQTNKPTNKHTNTHKQTLPIRIHCTAKLSAQCNEKEKALRETQTLRAGCSKVEPKKFAPPQTPFPAAQDGQNLISWRWSLPSPTDLVW